MFGVSEISNQLSPRGEMLRVMVCDRRSADQVIVG